jgi:hypothetical protein
MIYTIYNSTTGQILSTVDISESEINNIAGNNSYIEGQINSNLYYINDGLPVEKSINPSTPELIYDYDYNLKQWQLIIDNRHDMSRQQRNNQLSLIDRVNPIRYASLTTDEQQELIAYRQALLDVPQQSGFPSDITWPAKPTWL